MKLRTSHVLISLLLAFSVSQADVHLPAIFGSHMVLQRNHVVPIWGSALPGETVRVEFNGQSKSVTTNDSGRWIVKLDPMKEGGPFALTISGNNSIRFDNILIGEVWMCSGQSNMAFQLGKTSNAAHDVAGARNPMIRLFAVARVVSETPLVDVTGKWQECAPEVARDFSGVAYFFGRKVQGDLNVPLGLVDVSWGGTAAEGWIPRDILEQDPEFKPILDRWDEDVAKYPLAIKQFQEQLPQLMVQWNKDSVIATASGKVLPRKPMPPRGPGHRDTPAGQFYGMLHPIIPYAMRGVIWYQGESNASRAYQYRRLFPALITTWRSLWQQGDFPFYYVQLPNLDRQPEPSKSGWAEMRESQLMALSVPNSGMAVTIDVGDPKDLHPTNKRPVGERLALIALANTYGRRLEYSGPMVKDVHFGKESVEIAFSYAEGGLVTKQAEAVLGFTIAGSDSQFVPAEAIINGNRITVRSPTIADPVAVRYAWADNPVCNIYNKANLPASPFRTDDWPGITFGKK